MVLCVNWLIVTACVKHTSSLKSEYPFCRFDSRFPLIRKEKCNVCLCAVDAIKVIDFLPVAYVPRYTFLSRRWEWRKGNGRIYQQHCDPSHSRLARKKVLSFLGFSCRISFLFRTDDSFKHTHNQKRFLKVTQLNREGQYIFIYMVITIII